MALRIIFAGTPSIAANCLASLLTSTHSIVHVYTQPDRPFGRGLKLQPSPVKQLALQHQLPYSQPVNLKDPTLLTQLKDLNPDIMIVVAYGQILPKKLLTLPKLGCINVHFSLLPRWRGAAPVERAILAGDKATGITLMQMDEGLDTGEILLQRAYPINLKDTATTLYQGLSELSQKVLLEGLAQFTTGEIKAIPQNDQQVTYAHKINKEEGLIQWEQSALAIYRRIQAFNPRPIAFTFINNLRLRIWAAEILPSSSTTVPPGTVLQISKAGIEVSTGDGLLRITQCQLPGKTVQFVSSTLPGWQKLLTIGDRFSDQPNFDG